MKSLLNKSLAQFIVCTVVVLLLATPVFYFLTKHYYAEDLIEIIDAAQHNKPLPATDLEEDLIEGIMIQFALIAGVLGLSLILMMRIISKRLWIPFDDTLKHIERFTLEGEQLPHFMESDVREFVRLNTALTSLMENNLKSYKLQKQFSENASHELQTPLAVFQSKLDILLQQPDLTEGQADIVQSLYVVSNRLSRLNKNLLLLAKIENKQYKQTEQVDLQEVLEGILLLLETLTEGITVHKDLDNAALLLQANKLLLESLINNLIINAVRHNVPDGDIFIQVKERQLIVSNTSLEGKLDDRFLFHRFYRPSEKVKGNGLGLAIVKAICDFHGWKIRYGYNSGRHDFIVYFPS